MGSDGSTVNGLNFQPPSPLFDSQWADFTSKPQTRTIHFGLFMTRKCSESSLDHLVSAREQRRRHVKAERLGGFEVHDQLVLDRRLQGARFGSSCSRCSTSS